MLTQAVILVGVHGARASTALPELGGLPLLDYVLDELCRYAGIQSILLLADEAAEQALSRYDGQRRRSAAVSVLPVPTGLGTGGALKRVASRLDPTFFLLTKETFFDINLLGLAVAATNSSAIVQVALKREWADDAGGEVLLDRNAVMRLGSQGVLFKTGICCVDRGILDFIDKTPCSLERDIFPRLIEGGRLGVSCYDGLFVDIGNSADVERVRREMAELVRRPAVFFDRDGVLNVDRAYVHRIEDFEWIAGAREAIKLCNDRGYFTFVVTNQSGVARGYYGVDAIHRLHDWINNELAQVGAHIDEFQYCPYHEDGAVEQWRRASDRRKPAPGMILDCLAGWPVRKEASFLIGDRVDDLKAAAAAGIAGHLFEGGDLAAFIRPLLG